MKPTCGVGLAAVCASAVPAGIIASSSGRPIAAPSPRRTVRRVRCFFVTNMSAALLLIVGRGLSASPRGPDKARATCGVLPCACLPRRGAGSGPFHHARPERRGVDDAEDGGGERVIGGLG